jgi:hypothetical protein
MLDRTTGVIHRTVPAIAGQAIAGWRRLAARDQARRLPHPARLITRNGKDFTERY